MSVSYHVPAPPELPPKLSPVRPTLITPPLVSPRPGHTSAPGTSDTSSATLPVTWSSSSLDIKCSSSDSVKYDSNTSSPSVSQYSVTSATDIPVTRGPVIMIPEDDYEPQIMTEECQCQHPSPSSTSGSSSTSSGSMFYATFIPDHAINDDTLDEVSIVCNQYTRIETDSYQTSDTTSTDTDEVIGVSAEDPRQKNWKSTLRLPSLLDFWEERNKEGQFKKYASESNISKNQELPENGLRKILKDKNFTSNEDNISHEESDYSVKSGYEDHIYEEVACTNNDNKTGVAEESGFFSYENSMLYKVDFNNIPEESSDFDDDDIDASYVEKFELNNNQKDTENVTVIAVDCSKTNTNHRARINIEDPKIPVFPSTSVRDLRRLFENTESNQVRLL